MLSRPLRVLAALGVAVVFAASATAGMSRTAAPLSLNVNFTITGVISVSLPNGTPVGVTSGTPTVVPAGYYIVNMNGPGGCAAMPHFILRGPGVQIFDNLNEGESDHVEYNANLLPNSTYVWSSDAAPGVTHTFVTSSDVAGTAPARPANGLASGNHTTVKSSDFVGSDILPERGQLVGSISAAGKLSLAYKGKSVASLKAGRYTIVVTDKSSSVGLTMQKVARAVTPVSSRAFVGKKRVEIQLTAGKWTFAPSGGKQSFTIPVVSAL